MRVTALIVAAGSGKRIGGEIPKQFRLLGGRSVLARAVDALASYPAIGEVRVVIGEGQQCLAEQALAGRAVGELIVGGDERADSVRRGLDEIQGEIVLIHDAARPFCRHDVIDRLLDALTSHEAAVPVLPVADTLSRFDRVLGDAVDRTGLGRVQTPQAFHRRALLEALSAWTGGVATDESTVMRAAGRSVAAVQGDPMLDKLTTSGDWERAEADIASRMTVRTGIGFDVHAFAGSGPIMLGGVQIDNDRGLAGHSDADVLLHAITDALLGAAARGDIGDHFPPSDPQWKGASSDRFLTHAAKLITADGGIIDFVDCTIICEAPKIGPRREEIRSRVAEILGLDLRSVSVKATTTERLGFTGRREGIAAQAIATIRMGTEP